MSKTFRMFCCLHCDWVAEFCSEYVTVSDDDSFKEGLNEISDQQNTLFGHVLYYVPTKRNEA